MPSQLPYLPYVIDFANDGSFLITIEKLVSPASDYLQWAEYAVHYHASALGIIANITSEAFDTDFGALSAALQAVIDEFKPGAKRIIEFSHAVTAIIIKTNSIGKLDILISLRPDLYSITVFTFDLVMEQENAKRLIRDIGVLLSHDPRQSG